MRGIAARKDPTHSAPSNSRHWNNISESRDGIGFRPIKKGIPSQLLAEYPTGNSRPSAFGGFGEIGSVLLAAVQAGVRHANASKLTACEQSGLHSRLSPQQVAQT